VAPPQAHRPPSPSDKRPPPVNSTGWHEPKPSASPRCHTSTSPAAQHDRQLTHPGLGRDSPPYRTRTHCGRASGAALSPYDRPASASDHGALPASDTVTALAHTQLTRPQRSQNKDRPGPPTPRSHRLSRSSPPREHSEFKPTRTIVRTQPTRQPSIFAPQGAALWNHSGTQTT
jgi:hypothetical protein